MARIGVQHAGVTDLAHDLRQIPRVLGRRLARTTGKAAKSGALRSKRLAKRTARAHGKHYPDAIDWEAISPFEWEWGPDAAHPGRQGGMSFEWGSPKVPGRGGGQDPHLDLNNAADIVVPEWHHDIGVDLKAVFWV